ncbi:MAG: helix-turn-helix domain-containing protein [Agathobacter sp.]|nr:helix-turn-helix domain-containing protein [Agathobacter sp.]
MELGNKIKSLRLKAGLTQEKLADELNVSFQTISKWENNVCAPDITMLPKLSVFFGVTIDELFDLTSAQKISRIENMLEMERELPYNTFVETIDFLKEQLEVQEDKGKIYGMIAHVYHHRVVSDCDKVAEYAKKSMREKPEVKDCQWLLDKAEGAVVADWNFANHLKTIRFFKEQVENHPEIARNYLYLMDNLLSDNRTEETKKFLQIYRTLEGHKDFLVLYYEALIAIAEHDVALAEQKIGKLKEDYAEDDGAMFQVADYYASQCNYEEAIRYYEKCYELDEKPRFYDPLHGIALIYEIQGRYADAIKTYDRIVQNLAEEWNFTEGETVNVILREKQRLVEMM